MNKLDNIIPNMEMYYQNINEVNILDCFNYYQKENDMNGYCEKCGHEKTSEFDV